MVMRDDPFSVFKAESFIYTVIYEVEVTSALFRSSWFTGVWVQKAHKPAVSAVLPPLLFTATDRLASAEVTGNGVASASSLSERPPFSPRAVPRCAPT